MTQIRLDTQVQGNLPTGSLFEWDESILWQKTFSWTWYQYLRLNTTNTANWTIFQFQEAWTAKWIIEYLGTTFGWARQNSLEILTGSWTTADITFRPNDAEAMRIKSWWVINMSWLPTSASWLSAGDLWNNSWVLNIV